MALKTVVAKAALVRILVTTPASLRQTEKRGRATAILAVVAVRTLRLAVRPTQSKAREPVLKGLDRPAGPPHQIVAQTAVVDVAIATGVGCEVASM